MPEFPNDAKMPIPVDDAKKFSGYPDIEIRIVKFLESDRAHAHSRDEIGTGIGFDRQQIKADESGNYWTWENFGAVMGVLGESIELERGLEQLVRKGTIKLSIMNEKKHYYLA